MRAVNGYRTRAGLRGTDRPPREMRHSFVTGARPETTTVLNWAYGPRLSTVVRPPVHGRGASQRLAHLKNIDVVLEPGQDHAGALSGEVERHVQHP